MLNYQKRTKIVATIGPASDSPEILQKMIAAGMNIARLNFSHGTYEHHSKLIKTINAAAKAENKTISILQDLQGPRIRLGVLPKTGIKLEDGDSVAFVPESMINDKLMLRTMYKMLPNQYESLYKVVKKGYEILIADGSIETEVTAVEKKIVYARVIRGGTLTSHKGMNIPQASIPESAITDKDIKDLMFGLSKNVDFVGLSFVKSASDVRTLRELMKKHSKNKVLPKIIAKIERKEALKNFKEILDEADGIMVARGDLGVELPPEEVPLLQKTFIIECLLSAKPVIVATQMLESMTKSHRPTRAEVSDVANAVIDHADAVMLSGESAGGAFPVESVAMMTRIIKATEKSPYDDLGLQLFNLHDRVEDEYKAMAESVYNTAKEVNAKAIVALSRTGCTAQLIARYRPQISIVALVADDNVRRQLELVWGVTAHKIKVHKTVEGLIKDAVEIVRKNNLVKKGDNIVIVSGQPINGSNRANLMEVVKV